MKISFKNKFIVFLLSLSFLAGGAIAPQAFAVAVPNFPACANPQGTVKATYDTGTHGVPGDNASYTGKDTVYTLTNDTLLQCLCTDDGKGIQTNWWKVSSLSENEIKILENSGWIFVSNGLAWGLDNAPYLAQNIAFSCAVEQGSQGGVGGGHVSDGRSDGRTDSLGGKPSGQVLGFAFTGNSPIILSIASLGLILIGFGLKINGKKSK